MNDRIEILETELRELRRLVLSLASKDSVAVPKARLAELDRIERDNPPIPTDKKADHYPSWERGWNDGARMSKAWFREYSKHKHRADKAIHDWRSAVGENAKLRAKVAALEAEASDADKKARKMVGALLSLSNHAKAGGIKQRLAELSRWANDGDIDMMMPHLVAWIDEHIARLAARKQAPIPAPIRGAIPEDFADPGEFKSADEDAELVKMGIQLATDGCCSGEPEWPVGAIFAGGPDRGRPEIKRIRGGGSMSGYATLNDDAGMLTAENRALLRRVRAERAATPTPPREEPAP